MDGIPNNQYLEAVLPTIRRFYASVPRAIALGFLNY